MPHQRVIRCCSLKLHFVLQVVLPCLSHCPLTLALLWSHKWRLNELLSPLASCAAHLRKTWSQFVSEQVLHSFLKHLTRQRLTAFWVALCTANAQQRLLQFV